MRVLLIAAALAGTLFGASTLADAQTQSTTPSKTGCNAGVVNAPATPKAQDAGGGTAPGNTGNTGFTGAGLGGSFAGTSPNGPAAGSPSVQPATAKGLDPITAPPKGSDTGQC